uniref:Uncharacterized protein n=1 Tax=Arundo donax TaxID=35708 RepID=A0A0A8XTK7_ARUDO
MPKIALVDTMGLLGTCNLQFISNKKKHNSQGFLVGEAYCVCSNVSSLIGGDIFGEEVF